MPDIDKSPDGAVTLPLVILKLVVEALSPNVHPPPEPLKVTLPKALVGVEEAIICFPVVVALKVIVPPFESIEVELANKEPAKVKLLLPIVKIELVELPARRKTPSGKTPEGPFPEIVTAPPGANSLPGFM